MRLDKETSYHTKHISTYFLIPTPFFPPSPPPHLPSARGQSNLHGSHSSLYSTVFSIRCAAVALFVVVLPPLPSLKYKSNNSILCVREHRKSVRVGGRGDRGQNGWQRGRYNVFQRLIASRRYVNFMGLIVFIPLPPPSSITLFSPARGLSFLFFSIFQHTQGVT